MVEQLDVDPILILKAFIMGVVEDVTEMVPTAYPQMYWACSWAIYQGALVQTRASCFGLRHRRPRNAFGPGGVTIAMS